MSDTERNQGVVFARRCAAALIDGVVLIVLWQAVMAITRVRFPFGVMQSFSRQDYDAYIYVMSWLALGVFVLSIVMHRLFAGSIGKIIAGTKTVQAGGAPMTLKQIVMRSPTMAVIGLMILAPGPLIAFIFGKGSEGHSILALMLGFILLVTSTVGDRQSVIEHLLGLETVRRR